MDATLNHTQIIERDLSGMLPLSESLSSSESVESIQKLLEVSSTKQHKPKSKLRYKYKENDVEIKQLLNGDGVKDGAEQRKSKVRTLRQSSNFKPTAEQGTEIDSNEPEANLKVNVAIFSPTAPSSRPDNSGPSPRKRMAASKRQSSMNSSIPSSTINDAKVQSPTKPAVPSRHTLDRLPMEPALLIAAVPRSPIEGEMDIPTPSKLQGAEHKSRTDAEQSKSPTKSKSPIKKNDSRKLEEFEKDLQAATLSIDDSKQIPIHKKQRDLKIIGAMKKPMTEEEEIEQMMNSKYFKGMEFDTAEAVIEQAPKPALEIKTTQSVTIHIEKSDTLNYPASLRQPVVVVHFVNSETGEYIKKSNPKRKIYHHSELDGQFIPPTFTKVLIFNSRAI